MTSDRTQGQYVRAKEAGVNPWQRWNELAYKDGDIFSNPPFSNAPIDSLEIGWIDNNEAFVETAYAMQVDGQWEYADIVWRHGTPTVVRVFSGGKMWNEDGEVKR